MKTIPLTQGQVALVDDADYEAVSQFKWYFNKGYAARNILKPDGKRSIQYLHRFLMPGVAEVDHRDGNKLNDQRENLRSVTHQQNCQGSCRKRPGSTSKFRGVTWNKQCGKWQSQIMVDGKNICLGWFTEEAASARARDVAAIKYCGPSAHLNFPLTPTQIQTILDQPS